MKEKNIREIEKKDIVDGVLIPSEWDSSYRVKSIAIACNGEREVAITNLKEHPGLYELLRKRVKVVGKVRRHDQKETMDVESFRLFNETEPI